MNVIWKLQFNSLLNIILLMIMIYGELPNYTLSIHNPDIELPLNAINTALFSNAVHFSFNNIIGFITGCSFFRAAPIPLIYITFAFRVKIPSPMQYRGNKSLPSSLVCEARSDLTANLDRTSHSTVLLGVLKSFSNLLEN